MSDQTKLTTVPLPEELKQPGRKVEHFEVRVPSPLEVASMRDYPAAVMRAVALAANEAGMSGKRLDGFAMVENGMSPRIVFQVSSAEAAPATPAFVCDDPWCKCPHKDRIEEPRPPLGMVQYGQSVSVPLNVLNPVATNGDKQGNEI